MQKLLSFCAPLFLAVLLTGCMDDPINGPEVKPRLIQRPPTAYLQSLTGTTSLLARWNPSPSDTQANFKGYYLELYRSQHDSILGFDTNLVPAVAVAHTGRGDTSFIFTTGITQLERYSVYVWGERVPEPTKPDSLILSEDYATASLDFDPAPVLAPTTLLAGSAGATLVNLRWTKSASALQKGFKGYVIRYRDSVNSKAKIYKQVYPSLVTETPSPISLPLESSTSQITKFLFWIKALRNDSTESDDSTFIAWSGAYRVPLSGSTTINTGKKIFIGQTNTSYDLVESDKPEAQIGVDTSGGKVMLTGLSGAKFATMIDSGDLNSTFYRYPLDDGAYSETQFVLPISTTNVGVVVYILFAEGSRARLFIEKNGISGGLLSPDAKIRVSASFQPVGPFDLHYY